MGYPPTRGELRTYLASPPATRRPHRLTLLASSLEILEEMATLARTTPRRLPLDVGLEFDSGEGRGGFHHPAEISAAISLLRRHRDRLRLRAVLSYDGHATLTPDESWRKYVATQARGYCAGYLETFDHEGLAPALTQAAPVLKDVGPYPSAVITKQPLPPIIGEEYFLKGSTWPDQGAVQPAFVYPAGVEDDEREGGRCMVYAPPGELTTSDYVLCWPNQSGDGIDYFGALHALRDGRLLDVWPTFTRWGTPAGAH